MRNQCGATSLAGCPLLTALPGQPAKTGRPTFLVALCFAAMATVLWADTKPEVKEEPVGLVLNPGGGKLLRFDTETPLALRAGDLLFSGDGVRTDATPASYLFCPAKTIQTLERLRRSAAWTPSSPK